jgi:hypothetical protein
VDYLNVDTRTPTGPERAESSLSDNLRCDDQPPTREVRAIALFQRRAYSERRSEDPGVDADRR